MKRSVVKERDPHATLQARTLRHASCETLRPASRETRATRDPISTTNPGDDKPRDLETRDNRDPRGRVPIVCRMVRETRDRKNRMRRQTRETREPCAKPRARDPHTFLGAARGDTHPSHAEHCRPYPPRPGGIGVGSKILGHPRPKIAIGSHRAAACSQQAQSPGRLAALSGHGISRSRTPGGDYFPYAHTSSQYCRQARRRPVARRPNGGREEPNPSGGSPRSATSEVREGHQPHFRRQAP